MKTTCDSDVLSNFARGRGLGVREVREAIETGSLWMNAITLFETRGGMERDESVAKFDRSFGHLPVLALTREAAVRAGDLRRKLRSAGANVAPRDLLMAAIADTHQAMLVTADRDFAPLQKIGLDIDIVEAGPAG